MRKKITVIVLIVGASLLLTALAVALAPDLLGNTGGMVGVFAAIFIAIMGLGGGTINGWVDTLFDKPKEEPKAEGVVIQNVDRSNVTVGDKNQITYIVNEYASASDAQAKKRLKHQLEEYLDWVGETFGTIVLRGIERGGQQVVNIPLETIYVPLQAEIQSLDDERSFEKIKSNEINELEFREKMGSKKINLNEILSFGNRVIITGGPGSGKTTVLLHIAWALAASLRGSPKIAEQRLGLVGALPLPIYVPLTRYADYLRKLSPSANAEQQSLITYILEYLNERSANFETLSPDFLNSLLRDGKTVLLLLDGLDEVPNEDERILIRSRIEDLVSGRKNLRVAVTSRSAAYKGQAVLGRDFQRIHVLPLDSEQIGRLVTQAYYAIYPKSETKAREQANDLLSNIEQLENERRRRLGENIEPLVDSPILIRMLLIVHYNDRKLPDQRADLYQKTVDVILRPDHAPDQRVTDEIEKRIGGSLAMNREMLQHLAFHMHKGGDKQGREIEEEKLREILESEPIYKPYVNDLISQTRQRGTLLEERGGLYRFIHLSFQEFLVGRYLVQNFPDPEQLISFLEDGLCADPWWREPILLAIGYQDINAPIQARRILARLAGLDENVSHRQNNSFDLTLVACELAANAYLESRNQAADLGEQLKTRLKEVHQQSQTKTWTPVLLASAMDGLDRLGYVPDDLHHFIQLPTPDSQFPNPQIFISKYLITNAQYERFLQPENFQNKDLWINFPKFDENSQPMKETWKNAGWDWLQNSLKGKDYDVQDGVLYPRYWRDPRFGINRRHAPVVGISWYEAYAYCNWLTANYKNLPESNSLSNDVRFRLLLETEWTLAAGGEENNRFAFGELKNVKEELPKYANTDESGINRTTPVWMYPQGQSPHGLMDMTGNVWEWQANYRDKDYDVLGLRGGSWHSDVVFARVAFRNGHYPHLRIDYFGFHVCAYPLPTPSQPPPNPKV